jgi:glycosyltransferase involved in cell wall biosynthesis
LNILYISQYFPPEVFAPAARIADLAREWVRAGHEVRILTGFPNYPEGVLHSDYHRQWRKGYGREERDGAEIYRTWLYPAAKRGFWGHPANYCSFALSAAVAGLWIAPGNGVVIATSPQLLVGLTGYIVARARRLPFVFEVRDLLPQSFGAVGAGSLAYRGLQGLADFLYLHADRIVVVGEWQRNSLIATGVRPEKITVVRNGARDDFCLDPESPEGQALREHTRRELRIADRFVVAYAGALGMAQGLETVLLAAERLGDCSSVIFLLIGEGGEREQLLDRIRELRLTNVCFLGKQPREKVPAYLAAADVCVVPLRRREVYKTAIPSKMFEAMAAAKPVILGVEGEAKEILLDAQCGIAIPPDDSDALANAILRLLQRPELGRALGANGRRAVREKYSRHKQASAYLELLAGLVNTPRHHPLADGPQPPEPTSTNKPETLTLRKNQLSLEHPLHVAIFPPRGLCPCGAGRQF